MRASLRARGSAPYTKVPPTALTRYRGLADVRTGATVSRTTVGGTLQLPRADCSGRIGLEDGEVRESAAAELPA
jgi:hypothetical protein